MGSVKHIFVAAARGSLMLCLAEAEAVTDVGLQGDRYVQVRNRSARSGGDTRTESPRVGALLSITSIRLFSFVISELLL